MIQKIDPKRPGTPIIRRGGGMAGTRVQGRQDVAPIEVVLDLRISPPLVTRGTAWRYVTV